MLQPGSANLQTTGNRRTGNPGVGASLTGGADGFSLLEVVIAGTVLLIGVLALAGVLVSAQGRTEQIQDEMRVIAEAKSVMERIKAATPEQVPAYSGNEYPVEGVDGNLSGGNAIQVWVDSTDPRLLVVTVDAKWSVSGFDYSLQLETEIFNGNG